MTEIPPTESAVTGSSYEAQLSLAATDRLPLRWSWSLEVHGTESDSDTGKVASRSRGFWSLEVERLD